ncbi:hypothetical protein E2562_000067 [Oryza meyeriana var. granulata]|uniref:Uncharacterized protein n=1 Tax=Oryza meyeriana var. granulata TaxID=110450 RepID=A0A6G1DAI3_9ORYZ|nr:hypothetical protein E2562_000067 [Oryza meyeriana var. granulata]
MSLHGALVQDLLWGFGRLLSSEDPREQGFGMLLSSEDPKEQQALVFRISSHVNSVFGTSSDFG